MTAEVWYHSPSLWNTQVLMKDHQKTQLATKIITLFTFIKSMHSILEVGILRGRIYTTRGLLRVCLSVVCLWPQSCIYLHETRLPGARVLSHQEHPAPTERPSRHVPQLTGSSLTFPCLRFHQTTLSVSNGVVRPNPTPSCSRLLWRVIVVVMVTMVMMMVMFLQCYRCLADKEVLTKVWNWTKSMEGLHLTLGLLIYIINLESLYFIKSTWQNKKP